MKTVKFARFCFLIYMPLIHREFDIYACAMLYFIDMDKRGKFESQIRNN